MYNLTLGSLTLSDVALPEVVTAAAQAGFVGCGMRVTGRKASEPVSTLVGNPSMVAEVRRRLDDTGIRASNLATYHFYPELKVEEFKPVIDIAAQLGAKMMSATCQDPDESRFVDKLGQYAEMAAKIGARLNIEFTPYSEGKTIGQVFRAAVASGKDNVGIKVDPLHLTRGGGVPADIKKVDPSRIYLVQFCDAPRELAAGIDMATESRTARLYPGEGGLPLYAFLDALPARDELECGMPYAAHKNLPAGERAKKVFAATTAFLQTYLAKKNAK